MSFQYRAIKQNVTLINNVTYSLYNDTNIDYLNSKYSRFIENGREAGVTEWIFSMGTNFSCFVEYYDGLGKQEQLDNTISVVRTVIYAMTQPFQSSFFYWTLLLLILHKFNFKKPVMKLILAHFILRSTGDILDKFGDLMSHFFATNANRDKNGDIVSYGCMYDSPSPERNPLRWFLTRQIGNTFWYTGEIAADWYPLLRTRAVAKDEKSIWLVYISCALFNISKIVLISIHYIFLKPTALYNNEGIFEKKKVNMFYFGYWINQFLVIVTSLIYDFTVYYVLRKNIFEISQSEFGFLKKFRTISEYRIIVSLLICIFLLPIILVTYVLKFYYKFAYDYDNLNFSFDDVRRLIANVQYFMIFIDQILLLRSRDDSSYNENTGITNIDLSTGNLKHAKFDSKVYYSNLFKINNTLNNSTSSGSNSDLHRNSLVPSPNLSNSNVRNSYRNSYMDHVPGSNINRNTNSLTLSPNQRYSQPSNVMEYNPNGKGIRAPNSIRYSHPNSITDASVTSDNDATTIKINTLNLNNKDKNISNNDNEIKEE